MAFVLGLFPLAFILTVILSVRWVFFKVKMSRFERGMLVVLAVIAVIGLVISIMFSSTS